MLGEIWNCLHWPFCPGVFIAFLAFVTAFVAFRVEKAGRLEKGIWTFAFLLLLVAEIWMMGIDRTKHDKEQADARAEQLRKFQDIADQITSSNDLSKRHFDATMSTMEGLISTGNKSLAQETGNGQFCYLTAFPAAGTAKSRVVFHLMKMNSGPLPLDVCHVLIHDNAPIRSAADAQRAFEILYDQQLGPLPPGKIAGRSGTEGFGTNMAVQEGSYYIQINTRNDRFYETLTIHPNIPGKGLETIEVRDQKWKVVYSEP